MSNLNTIYEEHITMQSLQEKGIPSYKIISKADLFDIPILLDFFKIVVNYLNMSEKLEETNTKNGRFNKKKIQ